MYNVIWSPATTVITCYHPFILCL